VNPGRWNHANVPIVYCSSSLSLAALEVLVHVDFDDLPSDLVLTRGELSDALAVERIDTAALPKNWRAYPGPVELQDLGSAWVSAGRSVALLVPSAVTKGENNVLLNPRHPEIAQLLQSPPEPFEFDSRLGKK
jgi:RES domain-containing protein